MNVKYYLKNPKKLFVKVGRNTFLRLLNDEQFIRLIWSIEMDYPINLKSPKTYNEKLQWLKLYDRNQLYTILVDKYMVKDYVAKHIGNQYVIPTLGVWDKFEDIEFTKLPNKFVLKCTHDSGGLVIVKDKSQLNYEKAKKIINSSLQRNYYWWNREWPYKNVTPRIIAEPYLEDKITKELRDYKFFAFNGVVKSMFIATDRQSPKEETKFDFFNEKFEHLPFQNGHPNAKTLPEKPLLFEKMMELASVLSSGIPHVRVDFYEVDGSIFFGEMTFYHWSGFVRFEPREWDYTFGSWINIKKGIEDENKE